MGQQRTTIMPGQFTFFCFLLLSLLGSAPAAADDYPSKPIHLVVPYPPGGASDQRSRQIAEKLAKAMGQPVLVENKAGASGTIGAAYVAQAAPDGYTLLYGSVNELVLAPMVIPSAPFDAVRDFAPVNQVVSGSFLLVARQGLGVKSVNELITLARAKNGRLTCGTPGIGTAFHFALEIIKRDAHVDITHVPFKGGAPTMGALLGGHVDIAFSTVVESLPQIKAHKIVPLAVTSARRMPVLPDVPTAAEVGIPKLEMTLWAGVFAAPKTPSHIIKRLHSELVAVINDVQFRSDLINTGAEPIANTPDQFAAFIRAEQVRWGDLVKQSGMRLE